jgi:cyclophilin family peptidyl-prolyl cis-trans isomerase
VSVGHAYVLGALAVLAGVSGPGACHSAARGSAGDAGGGGRGGARTAADAGGASQGAVLAAIERAEDARRAADVTEAWRFSQDPVVQRRAIRALARIADPSADADLLRALGAEDEEVVGWAAYGLGWGCKGKEDERVKALAARAATLADADAGDGATSRSGIDARASLARAIGRCGGSLAEGVLAGFLRGATRDAEAEEIAYALGGIAAHRPLADETMGILLDRATSDPARLASAAALYPIGRLDRVPDPWTARVLTAARAVLAQPSPLRGFAVRALEKAGQDGVADVGHALANVDLDPAARAEAAHALGRMGAPGREAASSALVQMMKDHALLEPASLTGDAFNVLLALLGALGVEPPKHADASLYAIASLPVPPSGPVGLTRRVVALRCAAASALARAAYDAETLAKCDPDPDGAIGQRARLAALVRRPIAAERRKVFRALAASPHVTVREAALEAITQHPELEEAGRALLVQALAAPEPGVVATAAQAIVQHPEHVLTLAASERRAALDPRAPPPSAHPAMDLPADLATALTQAIARPWREDALETRTSLLDAAVAVNLPKVKDIAQRACTDVNITVREHAMRALRALGSPDAACPMPPATASTPAPSALPAPLAHPTRVTFDLDGAKLAMVFEPDLSPVAASRFVALAKAGFYRGIVVHRVVPGYVVQLGDPGGDGYGGAGELLRCETSPVPFGPLDVGVALAGRDTGSSQVFVTLGRYPKLDGDYARVGRAEGDWEAVAEGDVVVGVKVEE